MEVDFDKEIKHAIRHDFHKMKGKKHNKNNPQHVVPMGADGNAGDMSRLKLKSKFNTNEEDADDVSNYRLSLIDGTNLFEHGKRETLCEEIRREFRYTDSPADVLYKKLLLCKSFSMFNEDVDYPYTSLKYHTLLTANLYWNYLHGRQFKDLCFKIINMDDVIDIFDVVYIDNNNNKCFTISVADKYKKYDALAVLGNKPTMNFGNLMGRLRCDVYIEKQLFSNLRRIKSWSTGLQYFDDVCRGSI